MQSQILVASLTVDIFFHTDMYKIHWNPLFRNEAYTKYVSMDTQWYDLITNVC